MRIFLKGSFFIFFMYLFCSSVTFAIENEGPDISCDLEMTLDEIARHKAVFGVAEAMADTILDLLPENATAILVGRNPILLHQLLRTLGHFGYKKANLIKFQHVHFDGQAVARVKAEEDIFTDPRFGYYLGYLEALNLDPMMNEIYLIAYVKTGQSINSYLHLFRAFWQHKFKTLVPAIHLININHLSYSQLALPSLPAHLMDLDPFSATKPFFVTNQAGVLAASDGIKHFFNDLYTVAGGIYFPCEMWDQTESNIFNTPPTRQAYHHIACMLETAQYMAHRALKDQLTLSNQFAIASKVNQLNERWVWLNNFMSSRDKIGKFIVPDVNFILERLHKSDQFIDYLSTEEWEPQGSLNPVEWTEGILE
jgi:hypothetical protein